MSLAGEDLPEPKNKRDVFEVCPKKNEFLQNPAKEDETSQTR